MVRPSHWLVISIPVAILASVGPEHVCFTDRKIHVYHRQWSGWERLHETCVALAPCIAPVQVK